MRHAFPLIVFLLLVSCVPRPPAPPAPLPAGLEERLLQQLTENSRAFRNLQGLAKVKVSREGKSMGATQVLLVEKPDRLRAETLSPFGQPVLLLATNGDELTVFVPGEGNFYRGAASPRNLQRLTRIPLRLADLVQLLLYDVPVIDFQEQELLAETDGFRLVLNGERESRQELFFDRRLRLVKVDYLVGSELLLEVAYGRFDGDDEGYPAATELQMPQLAVTASLVFSEVRTNVAIPEDRFLLTPPAGVAVQSFPSPAPEVN